VNIEVDPQYVFADYWVDIRWFYTVVKASYSKISDLTYAGISDISDYSEVHFSTPHPSSGTTTQSPWQRKIYSHSHKQTSHIYQL